MAAPKDPKTTQTADPAAPPAPAATPAASAPAAAHAAPAATPVAKADGVPAPEVLAINEDSTGAPLTSAPKVEPTPPEAPKVTAQTPTAGVFEIAKAMQSVQKAVAELVKIEDSTVLKAKLIELDGVLSASAAEVDQIEKKGAKMAKGRLSVMEKAVEALATLVKELKGMGIESNPGEASTIRKNPDGDPPQIASIAKADTKPAENEQLTKLNETVSKVAADMAKLVDGLDRVTRVVKVQQGTLTKVSKAVGQSNAVSTDGEGGSPALEDVEWPLDLNSVPDRATTRKRGTSFYGDDDQPKA